MSTCVRKCTFARESNVGANSLNVVSRSFPNFSQSMLTPMSLFVACTFMAQDADATTACCPAVSTHVGVL